MKLRKYSLKLLEIYNKIMPSTITLEKMQGELPLGKIDI